MDALCCGDAFCCRVDDGESGGQSRPPRVDQSYFHRVSTTHRYWRLYIVYIGLCQKWGTKRDSQKGLTRLVTVKRNLTWYMRAGCTTSSATGSVRHTALFNLTCRPRRFQGLLRQLFSPFSHRMHYGKTMLHIKESSAYGDSLCTNFFLSRLLPDRRL